MSAVSVSYVRTYACLSNCVHNLASDVFQKINVPCCSLLQLSHGSDSHRV